MDDNVQAELISLDTSRSIWERFFSVAPLVLIGTCEPEGWWDFAPKHMVCPLSWENYFGFVCTPQHGTYHNIQREREFTVSYPRPSQILQTSLAATGREKDGTKPALTALPTIPATRVKGHFLKDSYLFLECELDRIVDGFGANSLIAGRIVAARVDERALRADDVDDSDLVRASGLLAYLHPGRFVEVDNSFSFPFSADFRR